jgi:hexokinase
MYKELDNFARHYGFHYDAIEAAAFIRDFRADLERGLRGEASSMPMIPSRLQPQAAQAGRTVIALDAGGTNLRAARIHFDGAGQPVIEAERGAAMPGTQGNTSAKAFYDAIAAVCAPLFEDGGKIEGIGFCFSYPMEMTADGDGILLALSKEIDAPEAVGKPVGKGLRAALKKRGLSAPERIVLLNDTAATLLSGLACIPPRLDSDTGGTGGPVIGFILGTGFNTAHAERSIPKIAFQSEDKPQIVVHESGTFLNKYRGLLDIEFDGTTKNPGVFTTEKACSGAYLGPLFHHIVARALSDGALRLKKADAFLQAEAGAGKKFQTGEINEFLCNPFACSGRFGSLFDSDEREAIAGVLFLASIVSERAALLSACVLTGIIEHIAAGFDPIAPVRIAVEGTTYLRFYRLRAALESRLHTLLSAESPRYCTIAPVQQASLFGAAAAVF